MSNTDNESTYTTPVTMGEKKPPSSAKAFTSNFTDASIAAERVAFIKILFGGCLGMVLVIFGIFSIYWGALWKVPDHPLPGWVIDLDGGAVGSAVSQGLLQSSAQSKVAWELKTGLGPSEVPVLVLEQKTWVAIVINAGASNNLENAGSNYNSTSAITLYAVEARNENAYRSIIRPVAEGTLNTVYNNFARQRVSAMSADALGSLASSSPQAISKPIAHTIDNLAPFNVPVASAITFVGLIYLLILSFFIVMIGSSAREISGLERKLTTRSLILVRISSVIIAYFFISLFYSLLSLAFQVDFSRKFGSSGFLVFWMINFTGMLSVGLALESMMTLLTSRFVPFFMIIWIITNVSVCFMPIEVLPHFFRYGYAMPFYNVSGAVRTIIFGTKNQVGMHFGILIAWACVSLISLPVFQWWRQRGLRRTNED